MNDQKGFSLVELVFVIAIICILSSMAVPYIQQAKMTAQERAAIAGVRSVYEAETIYHARFSTFGTLEQLIGQNTISSVFDDGEHLGYSFSVPSASQVHVEIVAIPDNPGITGRKGLYVDESGVIRYSPDGSVPTAESPPLDTSAER